MLADAVLVLHLAFILFVVFGSLLVLRWHRIAWAHLPAALWGTVVEFAGWICPLTPLENRFRLASGAPGYSRSFLEHYLVPIIYPADLTREAQILLGVIVIILNTAVYGVIWRRRARGRPTHR